VKLSKRSAAGRRLAVLLVLSLRASGAIAQTPDYKEAEIARWTAREFDRRYSDYRFERFCEKRRECMEAYWRCDVDATFRLLLDPDPWVRYAAYSSLRRTASFGALALPVPLRDLKPVGDYGVLRPQVQSILGWLREHPGVAQFDNADRAVTDEREIALWRSSHPDSRMLLALAGIGESNLLEGSKEAVYLLAALLEREELDVRARALRSLLTFTTPTLRPPDMSALGPDNIDRALLEAKKQEWLTWWKANETTFTPRYISPDRTLR